ncbi:hypothetical protein LCGC14_2597020, partial [marine sediment metagenome]
MKICFVTTHLIKIGGAHKFLRDYANYLSDRGHHITIIAQKIDQKIYKFLDKIVLYEVGGPL